MGKKESPLVSIRCTVYNHEPYLRQCLDGFVMQKTNFAFEAIVHDDASTDNSAEIIREYAEKYPDIIKPIYETENQYSKHDGSLSRIMNEAIHPDAKYIAICEGDDYWIDPLKLQTQVNFLETHKDCSMCFTNAIVKCEKGVSKKSENLYNHLKEGVYLGSEILKKWTIPTASVVFRNYYKYNSAPPKDKRFIYGDIIFFLWLSEKGKLWCINKKMVVYRRNINGVSVKTKMDECAIHHYEAIEEHFGYKKEVDSLLAKIYTRIFLRNLFSKNTKKLSNEIANKKLILKCISNIPSVLHGALYYRINKLLKRI